MVVASFEIMLCSPLLMSNGVKIITLHNSEGEEVGDVVVAKGNCGVGLDGRFFHVEDGEVVLNSSGS